MSQLDGAALCATTRCSGCQVTHALLPEVLWPRRMDAAEVIRAGLETAALSMGHRQIAGGTRALR
ncbi:hypothetical protein FE633_13075 [Streptomyces montanus]|uniref:Uncharacterized protein n=1 Tax=Streptomyces montanus TaxID=2580423 RepID=A0A5R9G2B6_9ACTN|nr:hypothetical protein [Streptomyces montanus]TLS45695.1 hypothetical protein FE633_13075 [Streptomyces montanus]